MTLRGETGKKNVLAILYAVVKHLAFSSLPVTESSSSLPLGEEKSGAEKPIIEELEPTDMQTDSSARKKTKKKKKKKTKVE